jgi:asparagine synthase (glutamine-hydrolysing)
VCGIAGIVRLDGESVELQRLQAMNIAMRHRGPDGEGYRGADSEIGFAHLRLAIIDLATGDQPMANEAKTIQLIFNGEIYNFMDVKKELENRGYKFRTKSDTEVLIHAYEEWGSGMLSKLNGMFAFTLYDIPNRKLFLARDRLGVKPLYYYFENNVLVFASEMGGMTASGLVPTEMDPVALDLYLHYQYIPSPHTIYRGVKKLPPSEFIELDLSTKQFTKKTYWDIDTQASPDPSRTMNEWMEDLDALLQDAVKIRLISDVPFGAFLSGGIDSGLIVAMMSGKLTEPVKTFSIGLADDENDELPYARMVAKRYGTKHEEFKVSPEGLTLIPKLSSHFGEPFADSSAVPTYYVSQIASSHVKMVLTGDGGDEMFAGYRRYSHLINVMSTLFPDHPSDSTRMQMWKRIARGVSRRIPGFTRFAGGISTRLPSRNRAWQAIYDESVSHFSLDERTALLGLHSGISHTDHFTSQYPFPASDNIAGNAQYCDLKSYLPGDVLVKVDRMSMANSLEVRSPLLDYRIAELAFSMPTRMKVAEPLPDGSKNKFILKELASRYLGRDYVYRPKQGFVIPISRWLREDRSGYLHDTLAASSSPVYNHLNKPIIQGMLKAHMAGSGDYGMKLWNLLMLDGWLRYAYTV